MNIVEALEALDRGETVRHESWPAGETLRTAGKSNTYIFKCRGEDRHTCVMPGMSDPERIRGGWSIVREQFGFAEAVGRMKDGKLVKRAHWIVTIDKFSNCTYYTPDDVRATDWEEVSSNRL